MNLIKKIALYSLIGSLLFCKGTFAQESGLEEKIKNDISTSEVVLSAYPTVQHRIDAGDFTTYLLKNYSGVFVGESHNGDLSNQQFMIKNLEKFQKAGLKVLAIEMVYSEDQQLIDNYYNDSINSRETLIKYTKKILGRFPLIEAAKKAGIKVIGIDMKSRNYGESRFGEVTREEVNKWWANEVKKEMAQYEPGDKFIVYGGFYHSNDSGGVDDYLKIPSIDPINPNDFDKPFFALNPGTIIIPGSPDGSDYNRVYATSLEDYCQESSEYYKEKSSKISDIYNELKSSISVYVVNRNLDIRENIRETVTTLMPQVEEWDIEYLQQIVDETLK